MNIRLRVLILIFVAIFVTGGACTLISRDISRSTLEEEIGNLLIATAQSRTREVEAAIEEKSMSTEAVSATIEALLLASWNPTTEAFAFDPAFLTNVLSIIKESDESIQDAVILDENRDIIASTLPIVEAGLQSSIEELFNKGKEGTYVGNINQNPQTNDFYLCTSAPIIIESEFAGVAILLNTVQDIFEIMKDRTGLGNTGEIYMIDQDGYMITPSMFVDDAVLNYQLEFNLNTGEDGSEMLSPEPQTLSYRNYLGAKVLGVHREVPETGWTLIVEKGTSEAFAPVSKMMRNMLWILLAVLGVGAIGAFILSQTITKPIIRLHRGVEAIMNGNLSHRVGIQRRDEIGKLSRAFDEMTSTVQKSREALEKYSVHLEEMVIERTRELSAANEELKCQIAERKKAQEEVMEANAKLREAMDQLKSSQEQLLQSEKLAAIGELVSGVAHEVNNPLMAISGYTQILLDEIDNLESLEMLEIIRSETQRATEIVRNLLSFARNQQSEKRRISINETIENTVKLRAYELETSSIYVVTDLDYSLPDAYGDPQQLMQVFLNLINNAASAMKEANGKGQMTIQTRFVDNCIQISFSDNGPGIPPEIIDRIFEPFFTTKDVGKGTGLGLSICYGIVKDHGGTIQAKSTPEQGATFIIELPPASSTEGSTQGNEGPALTSHFPTS